MEPAFAIALRLRCTQGDDILKPQVSTLSRFAVLP